MRFSIPVFLAAADVSTAFASPAVHARQAIGTFDTFTDENCSQSGTSVDVTGDEDGYTDFAPGIMSINSHLPESCALVIWADSPRQPPYLVVHPGRANQCIPLEIDSERLFWIVSCD